MQPGEYLGHLEQHTLLGQRSPEELPSEWDGLCELCHDFPSTSGGVEFAAHQTRLASPSFGFNCSAKRYGCPNPRTHRQGASRNSRISGGHSTSNGHALAMSFSSVAESRGGRRHFLLFALEQRKTLFCEYLPHCGGGLSKTLEHGNSG